MNKTPLAVLIAALLAEGSHPTHGLEAIRQYHIEHAPSPTPTQKSRVTEWATTTSTAAGAFTEQDLAEMLRKYRSRKA